jgi:hypothetical protein
MGKIIYHNNMLTLICKVSYGQQGKTNYLIQMRFPTLPPKN